MTRNTLTITDNRTGKSYEIPVDHDTIRAMDLRQIKVEENDFGMMSYDPAFKNTASTKSKITYIDGANGILRYRGIPIEQLATNSSYLEVAYLILNGELPNASQLEKWNHDITHHTLVHENVKDFFADFIFGTQSLVVFRDGVMDLFCSRNIGRRFWHDPKHIDASCIALHGNLAELVAQQRIQNCGFTNATEK